MHIRANRALGLFLAVVTAFALLAATAVQQIRADTGTYEEVNAYVLYYGDDSGRYRVEQASPYHVNLTYIPVGQTYDEYTGTISLYSAYDSNVIHEVFCVDQHASVRTNTLYQRTNLEDSTFFSDQTAQRLRTIVLNGYPCTASDVLAAAAGVESLTKGEALHATQLAIWQTSYGDALTINSFVSAIANYSWFETRIHYYDQYLAEIESGYAVEANIPAITQNVQAVFNYLMGLQPVAPISTVASTASFLSWSVAPVATASTDDTCSVVVSAQVDVSLPNGGDWLTLTAHMEDGAYYATTGLVDGINNVTLTIPNVPAAVATGDVTLSIDGYQAGADVFLYTPNGDRSTAQALIGYRSDQLPVHASVLAEQERIVRIYKTGAGQPLEGVQFDFYFVADRDAYLSGQIELPDASAYPYRENSAYGIYNVVTDSNGYGEFNLTRNNMPDGVYLVVEQPHPAIVAPVAPFYVILPATSADGTHLEYVVDVYPKNQLYTGPGISKDVVSLNNDLANVDAYAPHTWIVSTQVPRDLAAAKSFVVTDVLDNRLDYLGNLAVQLETLDGSTVVLPLTAGVDYTLAVNDVDSLAQDTPSDSFTVALTVSGMSKVAAAAPDPASYMIRIYFDAQINANAQVSTLIPNQATLVYTNSVGVVSTQQSDIPQVYTGAVELLKLDANNSQTTLAGAEFELYRPATELEVADDTVTKVQLPGLSAPMVKVSFAPTQTLTSTKVETAVTGDDGKAFFYGLTDGTYYLVETKAPAGYNLVGDPKELTIAAVTVTPGETEAQAPTVTTVPPATLTVLNTAGTVLPQTGGPGTAPFVALGAALVALACCGLARKLRRTDR